MLFLSLACFTWFLPAVAVEVGVNAKEVSVFDDQGRRQTALHVQADVNYAGDLDTKDFLVKGHRHAAKPSLGAKKEGDVSKLMRLEEVATSLEHLPAADTPQPDLPNAALFEGERGNIVQSNLVRSDPFRTEETGVLRSLRTIRTFFRSLLTSHEQHPAHPALQFDWNAVRDWRVALCCLILVVVGTLHAAAGIGGGGVYVVILMLISNLDPYDAVPLSKTVIFSGAVAYAVAAWMTGSKRDGASSAHVTDGAACGIVIPMTVCGTSWGVYFNALAPGYVVVGLLNLVLLTMVYVVILQTKRQREAEDRAFAAAEGRGVDSSVQDRPQEPAVRSNVIQASQSQIMVGVCLLVFTVLSNVAHCHYQSCVEGSVEDCHRFPLTYAGVTSGSPDWKLTFVMILPLWCCAGTALYGGSQAHLNHGWSVGAVAAYLGMAFFTGILSGLVGVGGGLVFSPFFVITGMDPAVAVGTSSLCVLFTSSSTTFSYILTDRVITSLAVVFALAVAPASVAGAAIVQHLHQHNPRSKSYMMGTVAAGIMLSLLCSACKMGLMIQTFESSK